METQMARSSENSQEFNPAMGGAEHKEYDKPFQVVFPDGTTKAVYSRKEAMEAIQDWRESVH